MELMSIPSEKKVRVNTSAEREKTEGKDRTHLLGQFIQVRESFESFRLVRELLE